MQFPENLQYSKTHEWVQQMPGGRLRLGLSDYAQHELGDIVFVNLPQPGDALNVGQSFADVESVKAVSDIFSPVSGRVVVVNEALLDAPEQINEDCYSAWLVEVQHVTETEELLDAKAYEAFVAAGG